MKKRGRKVMQKSTERDRMQRQMSEIALDAKWGDTEKSQERQRQKWQEMRKHKTAESGILTNWM